MLLGISIWGTSMPNLILLSKSLFKLTARMGVQSQVLHFEYLFLGLCMHVVWVYACGVYIVWRVGLLVFSVLAIMLHVFNYFYFY
uniref:Uncharacterized protein n=1 Tax=Anguilla anguilla TaxID=7936 RepID=A0A0E9VJW9_ANGAN